jgi:hypothetical protein
LEAEMAAMVVEAGGCDGTPARVAKPQDN